MSKLLYYLLTFAEAGLAIFGISSVYEQPRYDTIERLSGDIEIRRYGSRVAAEATVEAADDRAASSAAFSLLFRYITGSNRSGSTIARNAPVERATGAVMIAMTAPVEMASTSPGQVTMRFFLPHSVVASGAPEPLDKRVRVVTVSSATLAVFRFSGQLDEAACAAGQKALLARLARSRWLVAGRPSVLAYDPPFTISFLRRNEVAVEVVPRS